MRFPLRDVITPRTTPVVTWGLSGFTLLLHLVAIFALDDAGSLVPRVLLAASNVCVLVIFGENVEDQTGHRRFLLFYAACGAAAALAHARLNPPAGVPVAALSGAAAGVMGAALIRLLRQPARARWEWREY
jgi:hypothetical protein